MSMAVSMHATESALSGMNRGLSPVFRTPRNGPFQQQPSQSQRSLRYDLSKLRELARSDEFSDSESDGEDSDDDIDDKETMFVPFRQPLFVKEDRQTQRRLQQQKQKQEVHATSSPKGDDWTIVDKSPTFESVVHGTMELGGESWFVQP